MSAVVLFPLLVGGVLAAPWPFSAAACAAAVAVLAGFTVLTAWAHRRGDDFDCGCFAVLAETRVGRGLEARGGHENNLGGIYAVPAC